MNTTPLKVGQTIKGFGPSRKPYTLGAPCDRFTGSVVCLSHGLLHDMDTKRSAVGSRYVTGHVLSCQCYWWCSGHGAEVLA